MQTYYPLLRKTGRAIFRARGWAWLAMVFAMLSTEPAAKEIAGWIERVRLEPSGLKLKAKLDTGAKTSSLHATEIESYARAGEEYLRVQVENWKGKSIVLEGPLVRRSRIKRHTGDSQVRPVIRLPICLGGVRKEVDVNLVDRGRFNYQLLIGRSFLAGDFLIDPGQTYLLEPGCRSRDAQ